MKISVILIFSVIFIISLFNVHAQIGNEFCHPYGDGCTATDEQGCPECTNRICGDGDCLVGCDASGCYDEIKGTSDNLPECKSDCGLPCPTPCSSGTLQCPGGQLEGCTYVDNLDYMGCWMWTSATCSDPSDCDSCDVNMDCVGGACVSACGNGVCGANENCPADVGSCIDSICYEPACTSGCGQTPVPNGQTDEACLSPNFCDGAGNCVAPPQCTVPADCGLSTNICLSFDCVGGSCVTIPDDGVVCDDGSQCTNPDVCFGGICAGSAINCNDNNPCTIDSCDAFLGCQYSDEPQGTSCGAGMECDGAGTCISSCIPSAETCNSIDDDCDTFTDCADPECSADSACLICTLPEENCFGTCSDTSIDTNNCGL